MSNIVSEITDILTARHVGVPGTDLFIGEFPPDGDNMVMVFAAGGDVPDMYVDTKYATIDIWVRDRNSDGGYTRLLGIFNILQRMQNVKLTQYYVYFLHAMTDILDMDRDAQGRKLYKITFRVIYRDTYGVS